MELREAGGGMEKGERAGIVSKKRENHALSIDVQWYPFALQF
jgi:hypothetical protein